MEKIIKNQYTKIFQELQTFKLVKLKTKFDYGIATKTVILSINRTEC